SNKFEDFGRPRAYPAVSLLLAWVIVGARIIRGVKSSGKTWQAATSQVFFSLGLSFGSLMAYSASNKFNNNFSALGLGSQFALTDVPITSILELFPRFKFQRELAVIITGVVLFLISLPFTCPVRIEVVLNFISEYRTNISMAVVGFFEVYVIAYVYRFNRFMNDVKMMLGKRAAEYYLFLTWCILSPIIMLVITFSNLWTSKQMSNGAGAGYEAYVDPGWSTVIGW
ncbi:unnamed protein product, partial [Rotaria socialis]